MRAVLVSRVGERRTAFSLMTGRDVHEQGVPRVQQIGFLTVKRPRTPSADSLSRTAPTINIPEVVYLVVIMASLTQPSFRNLRQLCDGFCLRIPIEMNGCAAHFLDSSVRYAMRHNLFRSIIAAIKYINGNVRFYSYEQGATVAERLACSPPNQSRPGHSGFSHVGIVPDGAVGVRVFSGISSFPRYFILPPLHRLSKPRC
ncbi:hypothetical protein PR048_023021 [Dryococelus australis]|uniref:Uncharacterized protein n=1 Tax=Dryococelus australis TaxID=614101 RepID=A0ABQ9GSX8_9NEOP|nr:hypothetical protein PR048_023021 [Dryococelus australis]